MPSRDTPDDHLVLVDAANCVYRAFFAPYPPLRTSKGLPTKAVLGFTQMLRKVLREEEPTRVAVVFDARGPSFRHELFADYKATRDAQPDSPSCGRSWRRIGCRSSRSRASKRTT
jgi:DNA polymerase-1